ncbi:MAG: DUF1565 domain-containing protein [Planctomycetota bacterium]
MIHGILVSALLLAPAFAQELWVDAQSGNNSNPGTPSQPLRSITAALAAATPQTHILVRAGTYSVAATGESFPMQFGNGQPHAGVVIQGIGNVVIDLVNAAGTAMRIGTTASGGRLTNITFANMNKADWWTAAISAGTYNGAGSATGFEVDRCRFIDVNRGIILWQGTPILDWHIHDNLFVDLGNDGINQFDANSVIEITGNTIVNTPQLGVLREGNNTTVVGNVFTGCRVGLSSNATAATTPAHVHHNDFWNNTLAVEGPSFPGGAVPPGNLAVDPSFVNPATRDYHLRSSSALIDAGDVNVTLRADIDDDTRHADGNLDGTSAPDIGADEFTPVHVTTGASFPGLAVFDVTTTSSSIATGYLLFAFDEGLVHLPGLPTILLDPTTLIPFAFSGALPWRVALAVPPNLPSGVRLVAQSFGFAVPPGALVPGNRETLWF